MFGGYDTTGTIINSTWLWDGGNWNPTTPTTSPSARINCAMAWDDNNQQIVMYGGSGSLNDTWTWDGSNWSQKSPATIPTAAAGASALAYDAVRTEVVLTTGVLVGSSLVIQTWGWNGTNWSQKSPTANITSRSTLTNVAFDDALQSVVVFGGASRLNDTWTWNGTTWAPLSTATSPPATVSVPIVYDAARQQVVMYGGVAAGVIVADTWVLNAPTTAVTINVPSSIQFNFNGITYTGTQTINIAPGTYTLAVTSPQTTAPGTRLAFQSWDDAGAASHSVVVGATAVNITGTFQTQYSLTATSSPLAGGSVSPATGYYNAGSGLNLTPTPNANYNFSSWSNDCSGTTVPCALTMDAPKNVTANFASTATNVTVTVPAGVSFTLNGVSYQTTATVPLAQGTYTLSTTTPQSLAAGTQAVFSSWSDAGAISHSITVGATAVNITGTFTTQYLLTTAASPVAGGTVSPASGYYDANSVVGVTPTANGGYTFASWSGACSGSGACSVTMSAPKSVTANFTTPTFPVTVTVPIGLSFTLNGVAYSTTATVALAPGNYTLATTSPQAAGVGARAVFTSWSDGGAISHSINVAAPMNITGNFQLQYLLTTAVSPAAEGSLSITGTGAAPYYNAGSFVTLLPVANSTYEFTQWSGDCSGTVAGCFLVMNAPKSATAFFGPLRDWVQLFPSGANPRLSGSSMVYDPVRQQTVLFGFNVNTLKGETWVWNGLNWTQKATKTGPTATAANNEDAVMAFDAAHGVMILFGGMTYGETWAWNGTSWTQYFPANAPPPRLTHNMVYDAARGRILLFGGNAPFGNNLNDTWEWDGAAGNWIQRFPATQPSPRQYFGMAYDPIRQRVVMHGAGFQQYDTWTWDGVNWTKQNPATVASGNYSDNFGMAFDQARQDTINVEKSGLGQCDTWAWTGSDWRQEHPRTALGACAYGQSMAYDAARQEMVVYNGPDTWVYLVPQAKLTTLTATFNGKRTLNLPVQNQGNIPVSRFTINSVTVNGVTTSTFPSGATVTNITVGASASVAAQFPANLGASGATAFAFVSGTYDAGSDVGVPWSGFYVLTLP